MISAVIDSLLLIRYKVIVVVKHSPYCPLIVLSRACPFSGITPD